MFIYEFFKSIIRNINYLIRIILDLLNLKRSYEINGNVININYTHRLPDYQLDYPYYDKFTQYIIKEIPNDSIVIDVGANVGDSFAAMVGSNHKVEYLCIEASKEFYNQLIKNIDTIRKKYPNLKVNAINEFIGIDLDNVSLKGKFGTKTAINNTGTLKSKKLSKVLDDLKIDSMKISLIKIDVDGNDWDIINSSISLLTNLPYLYFECDFRNLEQYKRYLELFSRLTLLGYTNYAVFNNFGQFICCSNDQKHLHQLIEYLKLQKFQNHFQSVFYYDLIFYPQDKEHRIKNITEQYNDL